jgi:hypothetical protein
MKKILLLAAACVSSLAATAQTMNVHLKDGSTVQYASDKVDYVDFTAATAEAPTEEVWTLVTDSVKFSDYYYHNIPDFTCSLYKTKDGSKYAFRNFATNVDLEFTVGTDSVFTGTTYLGGYLYPTGGAYYDANTWYFTDSMWNESYPLAWNTWPAHYLDYVCVFANTTYTTFNASDRYGYLCLYAYPYLNSGVSSGDAMYLYLQFYWDEANEVAAPALTLADIAGTYSEHTTGYWSGAVDYEDEVTIEIADEATNTITVKGFSTSKEDLTGVVDLAAKTITFAANQPFYTWYTFSAETSIDTPVVGTIADDGTITISGWAPWYNYNGTDYPYASNMVSTLTKK